MSLYLANKRSINKALQIVESDYSLVKNDLDAFLSFESIGITSAPAQIRHDRRLAAAPSVLNVAPIAFICS